jgi:hypothetical protein
MISLLGVSLCGCGEWVASSQGYPSFPRALRCKSSKFLNLPFFSTETFPFLSDDKQFLLFTFNYHGYHRVIFNLRISN